jgi:hypothetical protein
MSVEEEKDELGEAMARAVQSQRIVAPLFSEDMIKQVLADVEKGNLPSQLYLIMHNQSVLDRKLNTLLLRQSQKQHDPASADTADTADTLKPASAKGKRVPKAKQSD